MDKTSHGVHLVGHAIAVSGQASWFGLAHDRASARHSMSLEILGPPPFATDAQGRLKSRVATFFPLHGMLVTVPGIHAWQRAAFLERLNESRKKLKQPRLSKEEEVGECARSVDLFLEPAMILIRPDPDHMNLAFEADEQLQELVSKRQIRFLFAWNEKVQQAIKQRGECWRMSALPRSRDEMRKLIQEAKVPIGGAPIYYYNHATGTRHLTYHEFALLERVDAASLAAHLDEIATHSVRRNRLGNPEVDFFAVSLDFGPAAFLGVVFSNLAHDELLAKYGAIRKQFLSAVDPACRVDDFQEETWRKKMCAALITDRGSSLAEEVLRGLSPEFYLQIEWLPGGHIEEGEFMFDSIFEEAARNPNDSALRSLCDDLAKGFIFNFIREYGDLEYVNVGRVGASLSIQRPQHDGRRGVYLAELKLRDTRERLVRFIRLQKWGIREHLEEGKDLLRSIIESEEYTDYILDRRLGCRQLGMTLPLRVTMRRTSERYSGTRTEFQNQMIWATYFERDYTQGIATDKLPTYKYADEAFTIRLGRLLGKAAASNMIVGRAHEEGGKAIFDDGDEVVVEDADGLPRELIVTDPSGAFADFRHSLIEFAREYSRPVNIRVDRAANPSAFAQAYIDALYVWFCHVQGDYRKRRRAFDTLFKHRPCDPAGSFAYRWECTLRRLDETDSIALIEAIRAQIVTATSTPAG